MLKWISLIDFEGALETHDLYRWRNYNELVKNAILSGVVPVRGIAEGQTEYQRIEPHLTLEADIDIIRNRVSVVGGKIDSPLLVHSFTRRQRFKHVQIDETAGLKWLRENADWVGCDNAGQEFKGEQQPKRELARRALDEIFAGKVPDAATLPNMELLAKVGKWLKANKLPDVSNSTILRAARRRK